MADLITLDQFEARVSYDLSVKEQSTASALIEDASALAVDIVNDSDVTDTWDAADAGTVPAGVVPVIVQMVRRGMDNPHGYRQESTEGYSYSGSSGVGVFATPEERKLIRKAAGKNPVAAADLGSHLPYTPSSPPVWLEGAL